MPVWKLKRSHPLFLLAALLAMAYMAYDFVGERDTPRAPNEAAPSPVRSALEVKGIEPGKTTAPQIRAVLEGHAKVTKSPHKNRCLEGLTYVPGYRVCRFGYFVSDGNRYSSGFEIAGVGGAVEYQVDKRGVVQSFEFEFDPNDSETILKAATSKWGKPVYQNTDAVTNAFGARFASASMKWIDAKNSTAWLLVRGTRADLATLTIETATIERDRAAISDKKRRDF